MHSEGSSLESILKALKLTIGVQAYSNIGHVCAFTADGADNTVTPDSYVQNEINFNWHGYFDRVEPEESDPDTVEENTTTSFTNILFALFLTPISKIVVNSSLKILKPVL